MIPNPIVTKLTEWLSATTSYSNEPKDNLIRKPNHERPANKWRLFYQYGPVLVPDNSVAADEAPALQLAVKAVAYDHSVQAGEIIVSGNGQNYIIQTNGSIRKI